MALVDVSTGEVIGRQVMPDLDAEIRRALRDSIARFGVIVPIVVDQHGAIIDGHNRWAIAHDLNRDCPTTTVHVDSEADALDVAATVNLDRRHMPQIARQRLAKSLRERGFSLRAIAGALGVSHEQVRTDVGADQEPATVKSLDSCSSDTVVGLDDRERSATRRGPWTQEQLVDLLDRWEAFTGPQAEFAACEGMTVTNLQSTLVKARKARSGEAPIEKLARKNEAVRVREITDLAAGNLTSDQIGARLAISAQQVRNIAKRNDITITADKVMGNVRRIDSTRVVEQTVLDLAANADALEQLPIDFDDLDPAQCAEWAPSVNSSLRVLTRFHKRLKEMAR